MNSAEATQATRQPNGHPHRWKMTPENKMRLMQVFEEMPYPPRETKIALAAELGVKREQVAKWFQHRRETLSKLGEFQGQSMRARRTEEELRVLQDYFDRNPYPSQQELSAISSLLRNVTDKQIRLWFKHKRKQMAKKGQLTPRRRSTRLAAELSDVVGNTVTDFTQSDLMALRGAFIVGGPDPPLSALEGLAQMLNRPLPMVQNWFSAEKSIVCQKQTGSNLLEKSDAKVVEDDSVSPSSQVAKRRKLGDKTSAGMFCEGTPQQYSMPPYYRISHPVVPTVAPVSVAFNPQLKFVSTDGQNFAGAVPSAMRDIHPFAMVSPSTDQHSNVEYTANGQPSVDSTIGVDGNAYARPVSTATYPQQRPWIAHPPQTQTSTVESYPNFTTGSHPQLETAGYQ